MNRRAAIVLCGSLAACAPSAPVGERSFALGTVCPAGATIEGVDVSALQPDTDWAQVAASGRRFALIKATEGDGKNWFYENPYFVHDWNATREAGMVRGAYHFFNPSEDGTDQANYFYNSVVKAVGGWKDGDIAPMMDWEAYCDNNDCNNYPRIANATIVTHAHQFLDRIQALTGRVPLVYTYLPDPDYIAAIGDPPGFAGYPLFQGDYGVQCPRLSGDWTEWKIWQYTSQGHVPGISKIVDLDHFNGTLGDLQNWTCGGGPGKKCAKQSDCCGGQTCENGACVACPADAINGCIVNGCGMGMTCSAAASSDGAATVTITVYNQSGATWPAAQTVLGTANGMASPLAAGWPAPTVAANASADVAPSAAATFVVPLQMSAAIGLLTVRENLQVMVAGKAEEAPIALSVTLNGCEAMGASLDRISPVTVSPGQTAVATVQLTNSGSQAWRAGKVVLALDPAGASSSLHDPSWPSDSVAAVLAADVAPGGTALFSIPLTAAPSATSGTVTVRFRLRDEDAGSFGPMMEVPVDVTLVTSAQGGCATGGRPTGGPLGLFLVAAVAFLARRRGALLIAAIVLCATSARADGPAGFAFQVTGGAPTDGGVPTRPSVTTPIPATPMGKTTPDPVAFSIPGACKGCSYALAHVSRVRISSDDDTLTFDDKDKRFGSPVVLHLGISDNHGDGTTPGGYYSPSHDFWTIAPVAADGTVSGTWKSGAWFACFSGGKACADGTATITVEVAAGLVPDGNGTLRAHFESQRRQAYQGFNSTTVDETIDLASSLPGIPSDAALYLGAVESTRISGDTTPITVNGQAGNVACADESSFASAGSGAAYSPRHAHLLAWPANGGTLTVKSAVGGWVAEHPSGTNTEIAVAIDGWIGGSTPGGELFYPGTGAVTHVTLDGSGNGTVTLPAGLVPTGQLPDVVVAVVTTKGLASDMVQVTVGGKLLQLGTSAAKGGGANAGTAHNPSHSDLVFAGATIPGTATPDGGTVDPGAPSIAVNLAMGGWKDTQDTSNGDPNGTPGVYVQILGAFAAPLEAPTGTMNPMIMSAGGCDVGVRPVVPSVALLGFVVMVAAVALRRRR